MIVYSRGSMYHDREYIEMVIFLLFFFWHYLGVWLKDIRKKYDTDDDMESGYGS